MKYSSYAATGQCFIPITDLIEPIFGSPTGFARILLTVCAGSISSILAGLSLWLLFGLLTLIFEFLISVSKILSYPSVTVWFDSCDWSGIDIFFVSLGGFLGELFIPLILSHLTAEHLFEVYIIIASIMPDLDGSLLGLVYTAIVLSSYLTAYLILGLFRMASRLWSRRSRTD
jgi:hypothetical protein